MTSDLTDLATEIAIDPRQAIGIPLALVGAVFLSLGAQFQHRGVTKVEERTKEVTGGLNVQQLTLLLARTVSSPVGSLKREEFWCSTVRARLAMLGLE